MLTNRPRGTYDLWSPEIEKWHYVENRIRDLCRRYGYTEVRTPVIEHAELFERGVGETTDVVEKEMYTFTDRGDRRLTLRPEGTAPVLRAYLENGLHNGPQPVKLFYLTTPMFRFERPQAGRFRQHYQFGVEVLGAGDAGLDLEIIDLPLRLLVELGVTDLVVRINSMGCPECRPAYRERLQAYYRPLVDDLCPDCLRRLEVNPLRLLDCKRDKCLVLKQGAPKTSDHLCGDCAGHFDALQRGLTALNIPYEIDHQIVRGFDYYTRTVFEIIDSGLGAQNTVCGGGRYDGLVEVLGGNPTPGIGFGLGMERLLDVLQGHGVDLPGPRPLDIFIASLGADARTVALRLLGELRREGLAADVDYLDRGLRAQMRHAGRYPARSVVVIGDDEITAGKARLRWLDTGVQEEITLDDPAAIAGLLRNSNRPPDGI
ncbi:MAG: histidine--tRNA ligase [Thermaerobacterales bacterium]